MFRHIIRSAPVIAAFMLMTACSDDAVAPAPVVAASLTITPPTSTLYEADTLVMNAVVRDASGAVVTGAVVVWSLADTARAQLVGSGRVVAIGHGVVTVTATSAGLTSSHDLTIVRPTVQKVVVSPIVRILIPGDFGSLNIKLEGPNSRRIMNRPITVASDNPNVIAIQSGGVLRAIAPGITTVRATSEGVVGTTQIEVRAAETQLVLTQRNGLPVPFLMGADSVEVFGVKEYHEVYLEGGSVNYSGFPLSRYNLELRIREYNVKTVSGQRVLEPRLSFTERDFGTVAFDARGDVKLTSAWVHPKNHTLVSQNGGMHMHYWPGSDEPMELFFRIAQ